MNTGIVKREERSEEREGPNMCLRVTISVRKHHGQQQLQEKVQFHITVHHQRHGGQEPGGRSFLACSRFAQPAFS